MTSSLPWPPHGGGNQRTNLLHRALSRCGEVDMVVLSKYAQFKPEHREPATERFGACAFYEKRLAEHGMPWSLARLIAPSAPHRLAVMFGGWSGDFVPDAEVSRRLDELVAERDYDLIVGRYMWALARSGAMGRRPTLLDVDDFETDVIEADLLSRTPRGAKRWWIERRLRQVAAAERRLLRACDHVWVAKPDDLRRVGHERASVLPNIPYIPEGKTVPEPCAEDVDSKVVMMIGTLEHPINVRALDDFVRQVWPRILERVPGAKFRIVGSGMTAQQRATWSAFDGVEAVGFVDDVRDAYKQSALTVVPIWEGGGTKIKVLESCLFGRACVCAAHSLRGYEDVLTHDDGVYRAEDSAGLVEGCVELLNNPGKRARIAAAGRKAVIARYSTQRFERTVIDAVESVCPDDGRRGAGDVAATARGATDREKAGSS